MRVLVVAPLLPFPPDHGWRVRTWHLLRGLAESWDVSLLTWADPGTPSEHLDEVRSLIPQSIVLPMRPAAMGRARFARQFGFWLRRGDPPHIQAQREERHLSRRGDSGLAAVIAPLASEKPFDLVVAEEELTGSLIPVDTSSLLAVHRLEIFDRAIWAARRRSRFGRLVFRYEGRRWQAFDVKAMRRADLVVSTSPETAKEVRRLGPDKPVIITPNGVDVRPLRTPPASARDLAFIGSFDSAQNVDAAMWFARECWPDLHRQFPDSQLRLVGRNPPRRLREIEAAGVVVTGTVPDIAEACEGVRVGVVSLREGMGIKNKTLDFLSMGVPVVSLVAGAEGIAATRADGLIVVSDPSALLAEIGSLMRDDDLVTRLGDAALRYVREHHAWDQIGRAYAADLEQWLQSRRG